MAKVNVKMMKDYINLNGGVVYYNDPISDGRRSLKVVYNDRRDEAQSMYNLLRDRFPRTKVRFLEPTEIMRDGYSVRIWVKE